MRATTGSSVPGFAEIADIAGVDSHWREGSCKRRRSEQSLIIVSGNGVETRGTP